MTNIDQTLNERGMRYGQFHQNAFIAQQMKAVMRTTDIWENLPPDMREALDQTASKISRLLMGDPFYPDNWRDIAGYATLILQRLEGVKNEQY